ncbi:MAG: hypothetical protein MRJ93_00350 [Nitrososphaeraceae archaeon]|nr:hypothetical protein [Nitrososphaeraceae archaeon]
MKQRTTTASEYKDGKMIPTTFNSRMEVMCVKMEPVVIVTSIAVNALTWLFILKTDYCISKGRRLVKKCLQ